MKHTFKKVMQMLSCVAMTILLLSSCGESSTGFDYLAVKMSKGEGWSIIDKDGKVIVEDEYPSDATLSTVRDGVYWVKTGDTYQLFSINSPKKPIVDEEFTYATKFRAGYAFVSAPNQPIRIINTRGEIVTTLSEDIKRCYMFSPNGYATYVDSNNKHGVIDKNGKIVIKAEYYAMQLYLIENIILAQKNEEDKKVVILDIEGNKLGTIDTEKFGWMGFYSEGKILVKSRDENETRLIALDKEGKRLFSIKKSGGENYNDVVYYIDGYVIFKNAEGKYGVADAEGNEVIRAKYNGIKNLGNGEFAVSKDDNKWGVVNAKDEIILDFDYSDAESVKLGENYCMKDGSEWLIVKKGEKEDVLASFYEADYSASDYATYISTKHIVNKIIETIEEYEQPRTAAQLGEAFSLSASNYGWSSEITRTVAIDDGMSLTVSIQFYDIDMTREKTHTERVSYGYYSYNRTVSDGWVWTNNLPYEITASLSKSSEVDATAVYNMLKERVAHGRKKVRAENDHSFYKNIKYNGNETKTYTYLSKEDDVVSFTINYRDI